MSGIRDGSLITLLFFVGSLTALVTFHVKTYTNGFPFLDRL